MLHPRVIGGERADTPRSAVALCEGASYYGCRVLCGGTLIAPNLVLTSRHCADVAASADGAFDCKTYRFSGSPKSAGTLWVTAASPVSNGASFHQGKRWDFPRAVGCGHDLALLTLEDDVPADQAMPTAPATSPGAIEAARGATLDVYGYGATAAGALPDGQRKHASTRILCVGGRDACASVPGGRDLLPTELAIDAEVCAGDSGSGLVAPDGTLLGALARTVGGMGSCAFGVYTELSAHALLVSRIATSAATAGGYPRPEFAAALEANGNASELAPRAFGAPCDDDADCSGGACRSFDDGIGWTCTRKCSEGCASACRGDYCFAEPPRPSEEGCHAARSLGDGGLALGFAFAFFLLHRKGRT